MPNKNEELKFGRFFIERLNKFYKLDYQSISNNKESITDNEVDIYATAKNLERLADALGVDPRNLIS